MADAEREVADWPVGRLAAAVTSGDRRTTLEALRDRLAAEIEVASGRDVASLTKQLIDVLKALDALPGEVRSTLDELAARRSTRRKGAKIAERTPKVAHQAQGKVVGGSGGGRARR